MTAPDDVASLSERVYAFITRLHPRQFRDRFGDDMRELDARPGIGADPAPNRPFDLRWLRDPRARFDLIGAVHRLDRKFVEGSPCGEARPVRDVFERFSSARSDKLPACRGPTATSCRALP